MMVERRINRAKIADQIAARLLLLRFSSPLISNERWLFWSVFAYASFTKVIPFDKTKAATHGTAGPYERVAAVLVVAKDSGGFEWNSSNLQICLFSSK
jgi:hypothetical protein